MMKVTIKELAEKAGVSKTAVSFAFNNPKRISEETYNRIMEIAKEVGYSPDPVARILATKQTGTIGILFPQAVSEVLQNPYIAELIRGIGSVCDSEGLSLTLFSPVKGILESTIQRAAVDGMIVLGIDENNSVHQALKQRGMPYVVIDAKSTGDFVNVGIDDKQMAEKLMDALLDEKHENILVCGLKPFAKEFSASLGSTTFEERHQGILASLKKHNVSEEKIKTYNFPDSETSFEGSYQIAKKVLQEENRPTAIYCMGDIQAFGFYKAAAELKIAIPDELSVVSFDDLEMSRILYPELTSVHQPGYKKGIVAAEQLVKLINGKDCHSVIMESSIIYRKSVSVAKK